MTTKITGLTTQQVQAKHAAGLGNNVEQKTGRSYWDIVRANLFTLFNNILFVIGAALIAMGRVNDAFTSVGIGLVNAFISTLQEIRAKRQLDQISLLTRPRVTVVRDGQDQEIDPSEIVQEDVLRVRAGDQIVVDGAVVGEGILEMDESLLTGEPNLIRKEAGDQLLSGSFCVTGEGYFVAEKVGADSFANQLTATARQMTIVETPLQQKTNLLVKLVMLLVAVFSILILAASLLEGLSNIRLVQIAAVLTGQVPYGLFLMIVVAYALGAAAVGKQGALVQQTNAVESLSNINVLCTDKTGTLTANRLLFNDVYPLGDEDETAIKKALGDFVRSAGSRNQTSEAILAGTEGNPLPVSDEVAFASARKWSALAFDQPERRGVYVLGAIEMLQPHLAEDTATPATKLAHQMRLWAEQGLRVLLFAHAPDVTTLHNDQEKPALPPLTPLALVSFPFDPAQVALTTFTVGIPAFFLTIWAKPRSLEPDILLKLVRFVIPVAILTMLLGVGLYIDDYNRASGAQDDPNALAIPDALLTSYSDYTGVSPDAPEFSDAFGTIAAQGALSIFISHTAFLLLLFLEPPFRFFTGWRKEVSADKRPALLAVGLLIVFQLLYFFPSIGGYFGLLEKPSGVYLRILGFVVIWFFAIRFIWRRQLLERFLGLVPAV